jgi:hypothetical protein
MDALLNSHPDLFKGGLGTINVPPVKLELNNELDRTPYHARAFPVPNCYEATTRKEIDRLCKLGFLGMVNYYRDMWKRRSHLIAPLTAIVSPTSTFVWTTECQKSFDDIKRSLAKKPYWRTLTSTRSFMCTQMLVTTS